VWTAVGLAGRVKAQAVSRRLPTAAVRVRAPFKSCGICGEQISTEANHLRVTGLPVLHTHPPSRAAVPSGSSFGRCHVKGKPIL
jgi:hypothetical protein